MLHPLTRHFYLFILIFNLNYPTWKGLGHFVLRRKQARYRRLEKINKEHGHRPEIRSIQLLIPRRSVTKRYIILYSFLLLTALRYDVCWYHTKPVYCIGPYAWCMVIMVHGEEWFLQKYQNVYTVSRQYLLCDKKWIILRRVYDRSAMPYFDKTVYGTGALLGTQHITHSIIPDIIICSRYHMAAIYDTVS